MCQFCECECNILGGCATLSRFKALHDASSNLMPRLVDNSNVMQMYQANVSADVDYDVSRECVNLMPQLVARDVIQMYQWM